MNLVLKLPPTFFQLLMVDLSKSWCQSFVKWWLLEKPVGKSPVSLVLHTLGALLAAGLVLFRQKDGLDVRQHTSLGDGNTCQKFVQLLVIPDGKLQMARVDSLLLVVTGSVASQLEDLSCKVLHDGSKVDWSASTDPFTVVATAEKTVNSTNWELKPCSAGASLGLGTGLASLSTSRHDWIVA